jgi:hypothetical protein
MPGEMVYRKASDIKLETFESYLDEMVAKYSPGTSINAPKYAGTEIEGTVLQGDMFLEIPSSNQSISNIQDYINLASEKGITTSVQNRIMEKFGVETFTSINFYERYKKISEKAREGKNIADSLEKIDKKIILDIFEKLGYSAKYVSKGNFFRILDENKDWQFNIHFSLKHGVIELIFGITELSENVKHGGTAGSICEDILYQKGDTTNESIKKPMFTSLNEFEEIARASLEIYEDMKKSILS